MIYSTTADPTRASSHLWITQLYAIALGLVAMVVTLTFDYRTFTDKSHFIYIGLLAVLLYVLFFGAAQMGARRWIPARDVQPAAVRVRQGRRRARARQVFRREPRRAAMERPGGRRRAHAHSTRAHREGAGPRDGGHAAAGLCRDRVPRRHAPAHSRHDFPRVHPRGARRLDVRPQAVSEVPHLHVSRSVRRMPKAPATSRFRRASRSDPAD